MEFEQLAGSAPGKLTQGKVAYITTGTIHVMLNRGFLKCIRLCPVSATCSPCPGIMRHTHDVHLQVRHCQKALMLLCKWKTQRMYQASRDE